MNIQRVCVNASNFPTAGPGTPCLPCSPLCPGSPIIPYVIADKSSKYSSLENVDKGLPFLLLILSLLFSPCAQVGPEIQTNKLG